MQDEQLDPQRPTASTLGPHSLEPRRTVQGHTDKPKILRPGRSPDPAVPPSPRNPSAGYHDPTPVDGCLTGPCGTRTRPPQLQPPSVTARARHRHATAPPRAPSPRPMPLWRANRSADPPERTGMAWWPPQPCGDRAGSPPPRVVSMSRGIEGHRNDSRLVPPGPLRDISRHTRLLWHRAHIPVACGVQRSPVTGGRGWSCCCSCSMVCVLFVVSLPT